MFEEIQPIWIYAISPIHAGSGRELGLIDMPIQKEKHTDIPKIEGPTIKGSMREAHRLKVKESDKTSLLFGPEEGEGSAGLIGFADGKLLFYPVKSLEGVFAYVTCPYLLQRYFEEIALLKSKENIYTEEINTINEGNFIAIKRFSSKSQEIVLDEYVFKNQEIGKNNEGIKHIKDHFDNHNFPFRTHRDIVIISDNEFMEIITLCKEVITRNKINHLTGTVDEKQGGLFTEEYLPSETILYTIIMKNGIKQEVEDYKEYIEGLKNQQVIQIGGNATIGKGIVRIGKIEQAEIGGE